jgi:hypothetical protein
MTIRTIGRGALLLAVAAGLGCSKKPPAEASPAAETAIPAAGDTTPAAGEVQLTGLLGCGHCTFHVASECTPCLKTGSGDVYVIDGVPEGTELWEKRLEEGHQITVTGTVLGTDAVKHIAMTSFEMR